MRRRYLVIRRRDNGSVPDVLSGRTPPEISGPLDIEEAELTDEDASEIKRKSDEEAIPDVALDLVEPVEMSDYDEDEPDPAMDSADATWGLDATGVTESEFDGSGAVVAVLDSGINAQHGAFAGLGDRLVQKDFTGEGNGDSIGHGTHCAATVFGQGIPGQPRFGVAPNVKKALVGRLVASETQLTLGNAVKAIRWAMNEGADIISMSFSWRFVPLIAQFEDEGLPPELAAARAMQDYHQTTTAFAGLARSGFGLAAVGLGSLFIAAAGNHSRRHEGMEHELSAAPPAGAEGVVGVGALKTIGRPHDSLRLAPFSNNDPDVSAPGVGVLSAGLDADELIRMSGTSMATPHVAGIAALWHQKLAPDIERRFLLEGIRSKLRGQATLDAVKDAPERARIGMGLVKAP